MAQRILIVEPNPESRQQLRGSFDGSDEYRVLEAEDSVEGLRMVSEQDPDLVLLDVDSPRLAGFEMLQTLRDRDIEVPVICLASHESTESVLRAFRLRAQDYLVQPFPSGELREAVDRALAPVRLREEREHLNRQLVEANQRLQRQLQELNAIYTIGRSVTSVLDMNRVLNRIVEAAVYVAQAEEGMLLLLDEEGEGLYLRAAKDIDERLAHNLSVRVEDSVAGRAIRSGQPVLLTGERVKVATGYLVKALLYLPLQVPDQGAIGVLGVANRSSSKGFSERDIHLLRALGDYAAIAIENARLFEMVGAERAKLRAILQQAQEPVVVVDEEQRVLLCNASARGVLDLEAGELVGRPIEDVMPVPVLIDAFERVWRTETGTREEILLDSGQTFNAQLTPIEGVGGVLVMQDITHLKELSRLKSEFVATVSHDLRTPLTNILGYVELLSQVGPLNEQQQLFVERVHGSMEDITALVGDLLDIGRIEAGFDLEMEPCDLVTVIDEAVEAIRPRAEEKGIEVRWDPPAKLPQVNGNERRLRQVMDNLLSNAVKYTQEEGWVDVSAEEGATYVIIRVADNGMGIPPSEQPYVFDKFYRVESEQTEDTPGTGLGLSIVRSVVEKHNGRIWVESKPGEGSVFSFVLPLLDEQARPQA